MSGGPRPPARRAAPRTDGAFSRPSSGAGARSVVMEASAGALGTLGISLSGWSWCSRCRRLAWPSMVDFWRLTCAYVAVKESLPWRAPFWPPWRSWGGSGRLSPLVATLWPSSWVRPLSRPATPGGSVALTTRDGISPGRWPGGGVLGSGEGARALRGAALVLVVRPSGLEGTRGLAPARPLLSLRSVCVAVVAPASPSLPRWRRSTAKSATRGQLAARTGRCVRRAGR